MGPLPSKFIALTTIPGIANDTADQRARSPNPKKVVNLHLEKNHLILY